MEGKSERHNEKGLFCAAEFHSTRMLREKLRAAERKKRTHHTSSIIREHQQIFHSSTPPTDLEEADRSRYDSLPTNLSLVITRGDQMRF